MKSQVDLNNIVALFLKSDRQIEELMNELIQGTDSFTSDNNENLKIAVSLEFLMVKLRMILSKESIMVKQILSLPTETSPMILSAMKKRDVYLASAITRLNEIREDFNSLQKIAYTNKFSFS